jgi:hypothetical protein
MLMTPKELETAYGKSIKPADLANFLQVDPRTLVKYADRWGGVQVAPGRYRFFENLIKENIENAKSNQKKNPTALERQYRCRRESIPKTVPGRLEKIPKKSNDVGDRKTKEAPAGANRHGLLNDDH